MERDVNLTKKVEKFCDKIGIDIVGFANPVFFNRFPKLNQPENYLNNTKTRCNICYGSIINEVNTLPPSYQHNHISFPPIFC